MLTNPVSNSSVDFVLVTALPEERDAVLNKLPGYIRLPPTNDDIRTYFQADLPIIFADQSAGSYRVIVICLLAMGRVQAVTATADAIRRWRPRFVVLIGIAGGIAAKNVKVGDILIADQIVDYELQKLTPAGPEVRWDVQRADARLLEACVNFRNEAWQGLLRIKRPGRGKPNRHIGPLASGDKVIAFGDVLAKYRDTWPKLLGVEMEAAGASTAAFQSPAKPGFFMIRGVSDLADENKGASHVKKWRTYACDIAASFAIALLQNGPVVVSSAAATLFPVLNNTPPVTIHTGGGPYIAGNVNTGGGNFIGHATTTQSLNSPPSSSAPASQRQQTTERSELGLSLRRVLWPLALASDVSILADANYDFPVLAETIDDTAIQPAYLLNNGYETQPISAFDLCRDYLWYYNHHIIKGHRGAGKTWLRLYLEYFSYMTGEKLLPLFYFAPATLAYETTALEIVQNLARSVANQLFADLLIRSDSRTSINDPWQISRVAIAPFLRRYGYTLPSNRDSLAQPIPLKALFDIALAFNNNPEYIQMQQEIDAFVLTERTIPATIEEILEDVQHAIELVGYQAVFVLVDNWDNLPPATCRRLLRYLLQSDLLAQLYQRRIFLKLFMPEIPDTPSTHFGKSCTLKRNGVHQLTLYTYRDADGESKPV